MPKSVIVYGYTKCSTVTKSLKYLNEKEITYQHIDNVLEKLDYDTIKNIHETSGLDIKKFFNTSGMKYRELNLKEKLLDMTIEEKYQLLATDGMLVKRPILVSGENITTGFKEVEWNKILKV